MLPLTSEQLFLNVLAGGMLALAFFLTARMRLRSMLAMFAWQSFLLAVFAGMAAIFRHETHLFITALLTFALKTCFIPLLLIRTAERGKTVERMYAYLRPATMLFCGAIMILGAFTLTRSLVSLSQADYVIAASSVAIVLLGLLMLVTRKGMYGQIVGFLLMENGIFTFGLTLTGGMPFLVELGIFFDVAIGAVLMSALSYRVQKERETVMTDSLIELVD